MNNFAADAQTPQDLAAAWEKNHLSAMPPSQVRHRDLQRYLDKLRALGIRVDEVGRSFQNREIYQIEWGTGATKVLMWSQMHGDEPTATSGLIDMFAFLQKNRNLLWVKNLESRLTIRAVPMLNPDGAEIYTRRNLQSIDINRDAVNLATPEGRLLKALRDAWQPEIGFNLHNQNPLTTVGATPQQATISLLAVSGDPEGRSNAGHLRNRRIASLMIEALENFIKGHIARYSDEYNPRAFGDRISEWGTPVILIETGALDGRDEMFLTKLNFVANLVALSALADGSEAPAAPDRYDRLPFNDSGNLVNFIFRRARILNFAVTDQLLTADISLNAERRRANVTAPTFVSDIGDLSVVSGLKEFKTEGFVLVTRSGQLKIGERGEFLFYRQNRINKIDFKQKDFDQLNPPDGIFKDGQWTKPLPR